MVGKTVSHYQIVKSLGRGGVGEVWEAVDLRLGRHVAVKFLCQQLLGDAEVLSRFEREARAAACLEHANVCTIYEIGETDNCRFLVMQLVNGEPLSKRIAAGPLTLEDAIEYARQLAEGLQAAHAAGVVHRDVKPSNVMITPEGRVIILDFGLALLSQATRLSQVDSKVGTPAYMSPEQSQGAALDHRTDLWSLGCVLHEMVVGEHAFGGHYEQAVIYSILHDEPQPLSELRRGVPAELERIVSKCLAKSPADRYSSAEEIANDLRILAESLASETSDRTELERIRLHQALAPHLSDRHSRLRGFAENGSGASSRQAWAPLRFLLSRRGAGRLGALGLLVASAAFVVSGRGPDMYYVYFVGDLEDASVRSMQDGFREGLRGISLTIDKIPVQIAFRSDSGDPEQAASLAENLRKAKDTLMVVGHGLSSTTKAALPSYLRRGDEIPLILPSETNPDLGLEFGEEGRDLAILRIAPDDVEQARSAASLARDRLACETFWIVRDTENRVYSEYLAGRFADYVDDTRGRVLFVSDHPTTPADIEAISRLDVDCVFTTATWRNTLMLMRQMRAVFVNANRSLPAVIATDACANPAILVHDEEAVEGLYVTSFLSARRFGQGQWSPHGADLAKLVIELLDQADERLSHEWSMTHGAMHSVLAHRVSTARRAVRSTMQAWVTSESVHPGATPDVSFRFGQNGVRRQTGFNLWQVRRGHFVDVHAPEEAP